MLGVVSVDDILEYASEGTAAAENSMPNSEEEILAFIADHIKVLLASEEDYVPCLDYLSAIQATHPDTNDKVSESWRRKLCEWCYEVVDHFGFDREVVSIALNFLDRVVAVRTESSPDAPIPKRDFQLFAVTSLYTAIKLHGESDNVEGPRRKLRIDAFVELSRGFFQVETIEKMERVLLNALEWRMNPPTLLRFVSNYLRLFPSLERNSHRSVNAMVTGLFDVARYMTELAVCVSSFGFTCKPSITAYASILCALDVLQRTSYVPVEMRSTFLYNLEVATGYNPGMEEVCQACAMLKDLCPSMFEDGHFPEEFYYTAQASRSQESSQGNVSPVSVVMEAPRENVRERRKRTRTTN